MARQMHWLAIFVSLGLAATVSAQAQAQAQVCKSNNGTDFVPGESWQEGTCQKCNCMDVAGKSEKVCYSTSVCTVKGPACGPDSKFVIKKEINPCCPVCVPLKEICGECAPGEPANPICGSDNVTYPNPCEFKLASCMSNVPLTAKYRGTCSNPVLSPAQAGASSSDDQTLIIVLIGAAGALILLIMGAGMALMVIYYLYRSKKRDLEAGRSQKMTQNGVNIADSTMSLGAVAHGGPLMGQTYDGLMGVTNPNFHPTQSPVSIRSDSRDGPESQMSMQQTDGDFEFSIGKEAHAGPGTKKNINENVQIEMSQRSAGSPSASTRSVSGEISQGAKSEKVSTGQRKSSARTPSPPQDIPNQSISRTSPGTITGDRKDPASMVSAALRSPRMTERSSATSRDSTARNSGSSRDSTRRSRTDSASTNPELGIRTVSSRPSSSTRDRLERERDLQRKGSGASMGGHGADKGEIRDHDDRASLLANGSANRGKRTTKV